MCKARNRSIVRLCLVAAPVGGATLELEGAAAPSSSSSSVNAGLCYFAYVVIIPQPSSHAFPGGCGGTENSQVLKISTPKK